MEIRLDVRGQVLAPKEGFGQDLYCTDFVFAINRPHCDSGGEHDGDGDSDIDCMRTPVCRIFPMLGKIY